VSIFSPFAKGTTKPLPFYFKAKKGKYKTTEAAKTKPTTTPLLFCLQKRRVGSYWFLHAAYAADNFGGVALN
jgi:hypothetical protein